jgi:hypothetical protein
VRGEHLLRAKIGFRVVGHYDDIIEVVKAPETFSNARMQEPLYPTHPEALAKLDETSGDVWYRLLRRRAEVRIFSSLLS